MAAHRIGRQLDRLMCWLNSEAGLGAVTSCRGTSGSCCVLQSGRHCNASSVLEDGMQSFPSTCMAASPKTLQGRAHML